MGIIGSAIYGCILFKEYPGWKGQLAIILALFSVLLIFAESVEENARDKLLKDGDEGELQALIQTETPCTYLTIQ